MRYQGMLRAGIGSLLLAFTISSANAGLSVGLLEVPIDSGATAGTFGDTRLAGARTFDMVVDVTDGDDWAGADMVFDVGNYTLYEQSFGGDTPSNTAQWSIFVANPYDTFVSGAVLHVSGAADFLGDSSAPAANVLGGAPPNGSSPATFGEDGLSVAWGDLANRGDGRYTIARLTGEDAGWETAADSGGFDIQGRVVMAGSGPAVLMGFDTSIPLANQLIPEPASLSLLGLGCLVMLRRRS